MFVHPHFLTNNIFNKIQTSLAAKQVKPDKRHVALCGYKHVVKNEPFYF